MDLTIPMCECRVLNSIARVNAKLYFPFLLRCQEDEIDQLVDGHWEVSAHRIQRIPC